MFVFVLFATEVEFVAFVPGSHNYVPSSAEFPSGTLYTSVLVANGLLASSSVEIRPSANPARAGDTLVLALSPETTLKGGTWAVGDSIIVFWQGDKQTVFPDYKGRVSVNSTTGTLSLSSVTAADSGVYVVQSSDPQLKANAVISVLEPVSNVTLRVSEASLVEFNSTAVLNCSVSSGSSLAYRWLNGSSEVTANDTVQLGDGGSTLTVVNVTRYDQGPFRCNVSNAVSSGISQALNLTIYYGPDNMDLTVNGQKTTSFITGSNLTMFCSAQSNPPAQFQWAFKGKVLNGTGPEFKLYHFSADQSGPYSCQAFNNWTNVNSSITKDIAIDKSASEQHGVSVWLLPFLLLAGFLLSLSGKF
ncbi:cell adhesion molecule CEACAM2-like [Polymixia lowei]